MFDVGQRVLTPRGQAIVVRVYSDSVATDRGTFRADAVAPLVGDRDDLRDPDALEEWLEASVGPPRSGVEAVSVLCKCHCRGRRSCHHIKHVDFEGETIWRSPHYAIASDCDCARRGCWCLK